MNHSLSDMLQRAPVIPVIAIDETERAVPLAKALIEGGIPVLEITLRTSQALESIRRIKAEVPGAIVGAGTVLNGEDVKNAVAAGSEFLVTPGITDNLMRSALESGVPLLPGVATVSEIMGCLEQGLTLLKFFPAEASGGAAALKAFGGPFPQVRFCPTGGIGPSNIGDYLALESVVSVGGSWLTPGHLIAAGDWQSITRLAREACRLVEQIKSAGIQPE